MRSQVPSGRLTPPAFRNYDESMLKLSEGFNKVWPHTRTDLTLSYHMDAHKDWHKDWHRDWHRGWHRGWHRDWHRG